MPCGMIRLKPVNWWTRMVCQRNGQDIQRMARQISKAEESLKDSFET